MFWTPNSLGSVCHCFYSSLNKEFWTNSSVSVSSFCTSNAIKTVAYVLGRLPTTWYSSVMSNFIALCLLTVSFVFWRCASIDLPNIVTALKYCFFTYIQFVNNIFYWNVIEKPPRQPPQCHNCWFDRIHVSLAVSLIIHHLLLYILLLCAFFILTVCLFYCCALTASWLLSITIKKLKEFHCYE